MIEAELREIEERAANLAKTVTFDPAEAELERAIRQDIPALCAALREAWAENAKLTFALVRIRLAQERRGEKDGIWAIADAALTREQPQPQEGGQDE